MRINPEWESIQRTLKISGATGDNPLMLKRDVPECGAVSVLFDEDLQPPQIRVRVADKPNLPPQLDEDEREYPEAQWFVPQSDDAGFLGWEERNTTGGLISSAELVEMILRLARKA